MSNPQEELRRHVEQDVAAALAELERLREPAALAALDAAERMSAARLVLDVAEQNARHQPSAEDAAEAARIVRQHGEGS